MGFSDWLFGTDEKLEKTSTLSKEQQGISSALAGYLQNLVSGGTKTYGGPTVAGVSPYERTGLGLLENYLSGVGETTTEGLDVYSQALRGMSPEQVHEDYMKYTAPAEARYLKEQIIPTFKESMVPGGTLRSTGTETGIADIISQFGEGQLGRIGERIGKSREQAYGALSSLPTMSALEGGVPQIEASSRYGALPRTLEQLDLNVQLEEFRRANPEMSEILGLAQNYLNTTMLATYKTQEEGHLGDIASIIGTVASLASLIPTGGASAAALPFLTGGGGSYGGSGGMGFPGSGKFLA